jgi:hypothetical protein
MDRNAVAAGLLVLLLLAGCTRQEFSDEASPADLEILAERPLWEPGYTWHWVGTDDETYSGKKLPNHVNLTVLRPFDLEGRSGWLAAIGRSVAGGKSGGAAMADSDPEFLDGEHLGIQGIAINLTPREPGECLEYQMRGFRSPPFLLFPLVAGKRWNGTERLTQFFDGRTGTFHLEAVVIGRDPITVQGVRYDDAVRIEYRYWVTAEERGDKASLPNQSLYANSTVMHYSPTARHVVKAVYAMERPTISPPGGRLPAAYFWDADHGSSAYLELKKAVLAPRAPSTLEEETYWWTRDPYVMERGCST